MKEWPDELGDKPGEGVVGKEGGVDAKKEAEKELERERKTLDPTVRCVVRFAEVGCSPVGASGTDCMGLLSCAGPSSRWRRASKPRARTDDFACSLNAPLAISPSFALSLDRLASSHSTDHAHEETVMLQADNALLQRTQTPAHCCCSLDDRRDERDQTRFIRRSIIWWKLPVTAVEDNWARSVDVSGVDCRRQERERRSRRRGRRRIEEGQLFPHLIASLHS